MLLKFNNVYSGLPLKAGTVAAAFLSMQVTAIELGERTELHGFFSQSYINTDNNNYFGQSRDGSFDFREAGINILYQARPDLHFAT